MSTITVEAIELPETEGRPSVETETTCACDPSDASILDGDTLRTTCTAASDSAQFTDTSQTSSSQGTRQHAACTEHGDAAQASPNAVLQFLTKTWLGNILGTAALMIAMIGLGITAYSSVLQAVAAKWTMRNDAFQSCLSASTMNISMRYCNELLVDGFEAPPSILRRRRDPSELRRGSAVPEVLGSGPAQILTSTDGQSNPAWLPAVAIVVLTVSVSFMVFAGRFYSRMRRSDVFTSLARLPNVGCLSPHSPTSFVRLFEHVSLYTSKGDDSRPSDTGQSSNGGEYITISALPQNALEENECPTYGETTMLLTKIGVSYYSEDDGTDVDEDDKEDGHEYSLNLGTTYDQDSISLCDVETEVKSNEMAFWFEADAKALRDCILEATTTCKTFDIDGVEIHPGLNDSFCAYPDLQKVLLEQKSFIKRLYVEAKKAQMSINESNLQNESGQIIQEASIKAEIFYNSVICSAKAFAILVSICVSPTSEMWARFETDCLEPENTAAKFADELLPFDIDTAKLRLGKDYEAFYSRQWQFCPVQLTDNSTAEFLHPEDCLRLPFSEKRLPSADSLWPTTRVSLTGDAHGAGGDDATLLMKSYASSQINWEWTKEIVGSDLDHEHVSKARMALRTQNHIYVFFSDATCNLSDYMTKLNKSGPSSFREVKACFRSILGIAEALRYLSARTFLPGEFALLRRENFQAESILVNISEAETTLQLAFPNWSSRNHDVINLARSSNTDYVPAESDDYTRLPGTVFDHYIAWLLGSIHIQQSIKKVPNGSGYINVAGVPRYRSLDELREMSAAALLLDLQKHIGEARSSEERRFYTRVLSLYESRTLVYHVAQFDLDRLCGALRNIVNSEDLIELTHAAVASPPMGSDLPPKMSPGRSSDNDPPPSWRKRLPWKRRRASSMFKDFVT